MSNQTIAWCVGVITTSVMQRPAVMKASISRFKRDRHSLAGIDFCFLCPVDFGSVSHTVMLLNFTMVTAWNELHASIFLPNRR